MTKEEIRKRLDSGWDYFWNQKTFLNIEKYWPEFMRLVEAYEGIMYVEKAGNMHMR